MKNVLAITKALADENRLRILAALNGGELCVCQVAELLDLAVSTVSKHLSILDQAELVNGRKQGRWVYYSLAGKANPAPARKAAAWAQHALSGSEVIVGDARRLKKILAMSLADVCKRRC
jgi:ArsR family transcriptional regulator